MPHVQTKCLSETAKRIKEQREESDFEFILRFWERELVRKVCAKKLLLNERNILITFGFFEAVF